MLGASDFNHVAHCFQLMLDVNVKVISKCHRKEEREITELLEFCMVYQRSFAWKIVVL